AERKALRDVWRWESDSGSILVGQLSTADTAVAHNCRRVRGRDDHGLGWGIWGWTQVPEPSDQISFFQIATSALMASMMKRAAEKASWRWGLATAMRTEGWDSSTRPVRWRMTCFTMGHWERAAWARVWSWGRAISG